MKKLFSVLIFFLMFLPCWSGKYRREIKNNFQAIEVTNNTDIQITVIAYVLGKQAGYTPVYTVPCPAKEKFEDNSKSTKKKVDLCWDDDVLLDVEWSYSIADKKLTIKIADVTEDMKKMRPQNAVLVENQSDGKKPRDYIKFTNNSSVSDIDVDIYAYSKAMKKWELGGRVKSRDIGSSFDVICWFTQPIGEYDYLSFESKQIKDFNLSIGIKLHDFIVTMTGGESTGEPAIYVEDISKYERIVNCNGATKDQIYNGILQGIVAVSENMLGGIYSSTDLYTVKGRLGVSYVTHVYFNTSQISNPRCTIVYTFKIKDGKYKAVFDNLQYNEGFVGSANNKFSFDTTSTSRAFGQDQYDAIEVFIERIITTINESIDNIRYDTNW